MLRLARLAAEQKNRHKLDKANKQLELALKGLQGLNATALSTAKLDDLVKRFAQQIAKVMLPAGTKHRLSTSRALCSARSERNSTCG